MAAMTALAIDTLAYAKRLKAAGVSQDQAEAQAEALADAVSTSLVTKSDLNEAVEKIRHELRIEIREVHSTMIRWIVPLMLGQTAATVALVKLL